MEIKRCCKTCAFFPQNNEAHELDPACKEYVSLDLDQCYDEIRDSILITLYGVEYLRNYYDEEEFEERYGWAVDLEEYQSKTGSTCPEDDEPWVVNETPYTDENGLKVCEFYVDGKGVEL